MLGGRRMNQQDVINEIRQKTDIVDIIGERIPLVARGKNFFGICPFHDDTSPSMSVSREKQIYTCFACHATGNVFTFLMNYEHKEFSEVLHDLAERTGVKLTGYQQKKKTSKYDEWYKIYEISTKYYQNNLMVTIGKKARDYLKERKITDEMVKEFEIGWSLEDKSSLTDLLAKKGYSIDLLNEVGLTTNDYDIYHQRLMFPLHDLNGRVIGFSGRIISGSQNKYLNTKETAIFKKGRLLYHYHVAKEEARKQKCVIIMEGFMDVIRASSIGVRNTVATMGTALTRDHIQDLKRLSPNIILCFDGDEAGYKATLAAGKLFGEYHIETKVISLTDNDDPDTYILKHGKDPFENLIKNAEYFSDYQIRMLKKNANFRDTEEKAAYIHKVLEEAVKIEDPIRVEIILKELAKDFEIGYNTLEKSFQELKQDTVSKVKIVPVSKAPVEKKDKYQKSSYAIIHYMLTNERIIDVVEREHLVFPNETLRALESEIVYFYHKYGFMNIADFYTYIADKEQLLAQLSQVEQMNLKKDVTKSELFDYFKVIREYNESQEIKRLEAKMRHIIDPLKQAEIAEEIRKLRIGEK